MQTDLLSVALMMSAERRREQEPEQNTEQMDQCLDPADSAVLTRNECRKHPVRNGGVLWTVTSQHTWIVNLGRAHSQQLLYCTTRSLFWSLFWSQQPDAAGGDDWLFKDEISLGVCVPRCPARVPGQRTVCWALRGRQRSRHQNLFMEHFCKRLCLAATQNQTTPEP